LISLCDRIAKVTGLVLAAKLCRHLAKAASQGYPDTRFRRIPPASERLDSQLLKTPIFEHDQTLQEHSVTLVSSSQ